MLQEIGAAMKTGLSLHNIFVTLDKIRGEKVEVVCKNFIPLIKGGGYNVLSGRGGVGKSAIALRAMVHYLLLNRKDKGLGYFTEDDRDEVETRLRQICFGEHKMDKQQYADIFNRCMFVTTENDPMWNFAQRTQNGFEVTKELIAFQIFLIENDVKFLILDPLKAFHTLNENDNTEMDFVVRKAIKTIGTKTGCCTVVLHHSTKGQNGARGASTISDSSRISYSLDRVHKKAPDGKLIPDEKFKGKVRLTIEKDNKNIFRFCNILDENAMFDIFDLSEVPILHQNKEGRYTAAPVEVHEYQTPEEDQPDIVHISLANHNSAKIPSGFQKKEVPWNDLVDMLTIDRAYSPSFFKDGYRNANNYLGGNDLVFLDIDDGMTLTEGKELFKNLKCIIMTTRSHQKEKKGLTCDRFRVILKLDKPIDLNQDEYKKAMQAIFDYFGSTADESTKDSSRFFFASPPDCEVWYSEGKTLFDWRPVYEKAKHLKELSLQYEAQTPKQAASTHKNAPGIDDLAIRAKNGTTSMLSSYIGIIKQEPIYCPFHNDRHPSAFVLPNKECDNVGIHCSSSNCTTGGVTQWLKKET